MNTSNKSDYQLVVDTNILYDIFELNGPGNFSCEKVKRLLDNGYRISFSDLSLIEIMTNFNISNEEIQKVFSGLANGQFNFGHLSFGPIRVTQSQVWFVSTKPEMITFIRNRFLKQRIIFESEHLVLLLSLVLGLFSTVLNDDFDIGSQKSQNFDEEISKIVNSLKETRVSYYMQQHHMFYKNRDWGSLKEMFVNEVIYLLSLVSKSYLSLRLNLKVNDIDLIFPRLDIAECINRTPLLKALLKRKFDDKSFSQIFSTKRRLGSLNYYSKYFVDELSKKCNEMMMTYFTNLAMRYLTTSKKYNKNDLIDGALFGLFENHLLFTQDEWINSRLKEIDLSKFNEIQKINLLLKK